METKNKSWQGKVDVKKSKALRVQEITVPRGWFERLQELTMKVNKSKDWETEANNIDFLLGYLSSVETILK